MAEHTGSISSGRGSLPSGLPPEQKDEDHVMGRTVKKAPSKGPLTPESREVENIEQVARHCLSEEPQPTVERVAEHNLQQRMERTSAEEDVDKSRVAILSEQKAHGIEGPQPHEALPPQAVLSHEDAQDKQRVESQIRPRYDIVESTLKRGIEIEARSLEARMEELHVPGVSIAVVRNGREVWAQGYGDMKAPDKVSQAASISKTVTALTVLSMVDDGTLSLETDVGQIMRSDPQGRVLWSHIYPGDDGSDPVRFPPVRIKHLLSHTAGTTVGGFRGYPNRDEIRRQIDYLRARFERGSIPPAEQARIEQLEQLLERSPEAVPTVDDVLLGQNGSNTPPVEVRATPGSTCQYSGGGTTILQKVIEIASDGRSFADIVHERVLSGEKLGMTQSTFSPDVPSRVLGHDALGIPNGGEHNVFQTQAAAGLWTTPSDLAKVAIGIQNSLSGKPGSILTQGLAQQMIMGQQIPGGEHNGLGVFVETGVSGIKYFYHMGDNPGYKTFLMANDRGDAVVIMTDSDMGDFLNTEIFDALSQQWPDAEIVRSPPPPPPLSVVEMAEWNAIHEGTYSSTDASGQTYFIEISKLSDGSVSLQPSWGGPPYTLFPMSDTQACYKKSDDGPVETLQFTPSGSGSMSVTFLGGEWTKK